MQEQPKYSFYASMKEKKKDSTLGV